MARLLWYLTGLLPVLFNGWLLFRMSAPFARPRRPWCRAALVLMFGISSCMIIWVGDPNLLYTLPVYCACFFLFTRGSRVGRLAVAAILFCLMMSVSAIADTYLGDFLEDYQWGYYFPSLARMAALGAIYLVFRCRFPPEPVSLSDRLWRLILGLAAMPLCTLAAVVLLTYQRYYSDAVARLSLNQGMVVLPIVLLTSLLLLRAVLVLADHEKLERAGHLASLREVYYQGFRQREVQVRQLRHDLRNHLTAAQGLLERGDAAGASAYLERLSGQAGLRAPRHWCENEMADIVLSAKAEELEREGVRLEFAVALPAALPMAETDLCALLGNALDNAKEGVRGCADPWVLLRCRVDKGLLMLRVENPTAREPVGDLSTTKADKTAHGFGIPGMREIAERCGGSLEAGAGQGRFRLLVSVPLNGEPVPSKCMKS